MKDLISHIVGNAVAYINTYKTKNELTEKEKGVLLGLWITLDSIKNHVIDNDIETNENVEDIMNELNNLIINN